MTPRFRTASLFGALAACLWAATAWAGDATLQEDAVRAMQRGQSLIQEGRYKEASAEFERASDLRAETVTEALI